MSGWDLLVYLSDRDTAGCMARPEGHRVSILSQPPWQWPLSHFLRHSWQWWQAPTELCRWCTPPWLPVEQPRSPLAPSTAPTPHTVGRDPDWPHVHLDKTRNEVVMRQMHLIDWVKPEWTEQKKHLPYLHHSVFFPVSVALHLALPGTILPQ